MIYWHQCIWGSELRSPAWRARVLSRGAVIGKTSKTGKTSVLPCFCRIEHGSSSTWRTDMAVLPGCGTGSSGAPINPAFSRTNRSRKCGIRMEHMSKRYIFSILTVLLLNPPVLRVIDASIIDYDGFMFLSFKLSSTVGNLANTKYFLLL